MPAPKDPIKYKLYIERLKLSHTGKKFSDGTKEKMSLTRKGKIPKNLAWLTSPELNKKRSEKMRRENWDGGYSAVHAWVIKKKGKASKCEDCSKETGKIEWSNKDHKYQRILGDYNARCVSCHRKYDLSQGLIKNNYHL